MPNKALNYDAVAASIIAWEKTDVDARVELYRQKLRLKFENKPNLREVQGRHLLEFTIDKSVEYVKEICADYLNEILKLSGQNIRFRSSDFVQFNIDGIAYFGSPDANAHHLDRAVLTLETKQ